MKKRIMLLLISFIASSCKNVDISDPAKDIPSQYEPKISSPILITSMGQSIDYIMLEGILDNLKIDYNTIPKATYNDMIAYPTLIAVIGSSKKGMNFSNTTLEDELERINYLHKSDIDNEMNVILIHMGGKNRRGITSDKIINTALPIADAIIVVEDGNYDNLFSNYANTNDIWFVEIQDMHELQDTIKNLIE